MRVGLVLLAMLLLGIPALGKKPKKPVERPTQFEMGVLTFFDFGPPFEYYGLYVARPAEDGARIERMILTPQGDKCFAPAKIEKATATLHETIDQLLGARNPCEIPEKELKRELKRCKHCLTFSGAKVTMQVKCGGVTRLIRSDILDRDMFDSAVKTPGNTSWTISLLNNLDKAAGPGVMDKPMFSTSDEPTSQPTTDEEGTILTAMAEGRFDDLFSGESLKLSDLYKQTQIARGAHPEVTIKETTPRTPEQLVVPKYPPLTLLAHAEGTVTANFTILDDGTPGLLPMLTGNAVLQRAVEDALRNWRFPKEAAGEQEQVTFEFRLHCPK